MISDQLGGLLHGRSSRGELLSTVEIEQLESWYAQQDAAEAQSLKMPTVDVDCVALQAQIDATLEKITGVSQEIRQVSAENFALRWQAQQEDQSLAEACGLVDQLGLGWDEACQDAMITVANTW